MSAVHVYLARTSICDCGYPLLDERIVAGRQTDYYASPDRAATFTFICGGCGRQQRVDGWFVHEKQWPWGRSAAGFLPAKVFEVLE